LGLMVSGEKVFSKDLINQKKDAYIRQWNSYYTFAKTEESNKFFFKYKEFLISAFIMSMKEMTEFESDYRVKNSNSDFIIRKLAEDEINSFKVSDIEDSYDVALRLIAKCRFYYTSAYPILSDIQEAGKSNPNVDVREAALLAAINYVADYLTAQISIGK